MRSSLSFFHSFCIRSNKISRLFSMPLLPTLIKISPLFANSSEITPWREGADCLLLRKLRVNQPCGKSHRTAHSSVFPHFRSFTVLRPLRLTMSFFRYFNLGPLATEKPYIQSLHLMAYTRDVYRVRVSGFVLTNPDEKKLASANPATPGRQTHATQFS